MWSAGVGWRDGDFEVVVLDEAGAEVVPPVVVPGGDKTRLVELLRHTSERAGGDLAAVIESTNGMLDGHLLAAGLRVYRADPAVLPDRPPLGSVPARDLAESARRELSALHGLSIRTGTMTGRGEETRGHLAGSAATERELQPVGRFVERGSDDVPEIALTFDDGPHPAYTPQVLDILGRYDITASFFCVGLNVQAHPELVARTAGEGHLVGNHTWSHPYLPDLSRDQLMRQVDATNEALTKATGTGSTLVRPPYGVRTSDVLTWLAERDMTTVFWNSDIGDWGLPGADAIVSAAVERTTNGSVLLLHDAGGDRSQTVEALPRILEGLLGRGFQFVTIDELAPWSPPSV